MNYKNLMTVQIHGNHNSDSKFLKEAEIFIKDTLNSTAHRLDILKRLDLALGVEEEVYNEKVLKESISQI